MKRKVTDLFDEKKNNSKFKSQNFEYGITVNKSLDKKKVIINAEAITFLGAKLENRLVEIMETELVSNFKFHKFKNIFVIGLGNKDVPCDSLGPKVVEKLVVSRGLDMNPKLCAFAPNVFSNTGIETSEIVGSISNHIKPDLVILIDSLATVSVSRLCSCFQISKGGLVAGSGSATNNKKISSSFLGVKNIVSIGVPMLIYANSLNAVDGEGNKLSSFPSLVLSPSDITKSIDLLSDIIAMAINKAVFRNLCEDEIEALVK